MKTDLDSKKEKLEQAQNDLSAWKFTLDRWCCWFFSATLNDLLTTVLTSYVMFIRSLFRVKWIRSDVEINRFCSHGTGLFMSSLFTLNLSAIVRFWRLRWKQEPVLDDIGLLHLQKGRVLNRSPAYLYKTVYTLLLLLFFSFWDQRPKNVVDLYRRVGNRLCIKKRKQKCATEPIVSGLKVPFTRAKRDVTARTKNDTWPFESTLLSPTQPFLSRRATLLLNKWLLTFELFGRSVAWRDKNGCEGDKFECYLFRS